MGLWLTSENKEFALGYMSFNLWRDNLAQSAGYEKAKVTYDDEPWPRETILIDWGHISHDNVMGKWLKDEEPKDPLIYLITHSDCDGSLQPRHAGLVADRIEELKDTEIMKSNERLPRISKGILAVFRDAQKTGQPVEFH